MSNGNYRGLDDSKRILYKDNEIFNRSLAERNCL